MFLCSNYTYNKKLSSQCTLCFQKNKEPFLKKEKDCECPYLGKANLIAIINTSQIYYPKHNGTLSIKTVLNDGEEVYKTDEGTFLVDKDNYLILNHGQEYSSWIDTVKNTESFCLFFSGDFFYDVYNVLTKKEVRFLNESDPGFKELLFIEKLYDKDELINFLLKNIYHLIKTANITKEYLEDVFCKIAEHLLYINYDIKSEIEEISAIRYSTRFEIFKRLNLARDFIYSNINKEIDLNSISAIASFSPYHFLRLFKQVFRETPHQYLMKIRVEKAKSMLLNTKLSITDISLDTGFDSPSHFSRIFRRYYDVSPREFRNEFFVKRLII